MFCRKCGKELPEGAKFCTACGEQVAKADMAESKQQNKSTNGAARKKTIFIGVIALVAILAVILIINAISKPSDSKETPNTGKTASKDTKGGFDSYEDAVDAYFTAAFNKDVEAAVSCFPTEMKQYVIQIYNNYRSGSYNSETEMFNFLAENLETEFSYEIDDATKLTQNEIDELQTSYGIEVDEGYAVNVTVTGRYYCPMPIYGSDGFKGWEDGYTTEYPHGTIKAVKIGKSWYIVEPLKGDYLWSTFHMTTIPWLE